MKLRQISVSLERSLRRRINRIDSLSIKKEDFERTAHVLKLMDAVYPNFTSDLFILEISSTEFSSEFRLSGEQRIIVFDHEQVNSLNWFVNLNLKIEHPIFHYNEFMIRSGELLASWGEIQAAKRIHERIEEAWRSYNSAITTPYPYWRPFYPDGLKSVSRVVDYLAHSFVLGHEIGHHFQT